MCTPPLSDLPVLVVVPFMSYIEPMLDCAVMKVTALVTDAKNPNRVYLAEDDVVLEDPPISLQVSLLCICLRTPRLRFGNNWCVLVVKRSHGDRVCSGSGRGHSWRSVVYLTESSIAPKRLHQMTLSATGSSGVMATEPEFVAQGDHEVL